MAGRSKRIAIFYHVVAKDNAIGMVDRVILENLCEKYEFTVFATIFDNPRPDRIIWVRVPVVAGTALLTALTYRLNARVIYFWQRTLRRKKYEIVQSSDAVFGHADIADAHFCNRYYLTHVMQKKITDLRSAAALALRCISSVLERRVYRKAAVMVAPSPGLRRELVSAHGIDPARIAVVPYPNDRDIHPPGTVDRLKARSELGLADSHVTLVFAALGDFERKGLGPLIDALADPRLACVRLLVVGGSAGSLAAYRARALRQNVHERVIFCGKHPSIRSFLWASDAFVFPSKYETYSVVTMQAALSALPLITTRMNGVEEYARDGITGFLIGECTRNAIANAISRFLSLPEEERRNLGRNASDAVQDYTVERFVNSWDCIYSRYGTDSAT